MDQDEKSPEQSSDKPADRDAKGYFTKGHSVGKDHRWTKDDHPISPGRPKSRLITKEIEKWLGRQASELSIASKAAKSLGLVPSEITVAEAFGITMLLHSMKGKDGIVKEVLKRIEGEVPKTLNLGGDPFDDYLKAMRDKTQFDPEPPTEDDTDADA